MRLRCCLKLTLIITLCVPAGSLHAQSPSDWPMYNRDLAGTRHSPLDEINTGNVDQLVQAWSYTLGADPSAGGLSGGLSIYAAGDRLHDVPGCGRPRCRTRP